MDLEGMNLRDKRNRFQVNRVDSVATGHHSPSAGEINGPEVRHGPTLVGYKEYNASPSGEGNYHINPLANFGGNCGGGRDEGDTVNNIRRTSCSFQMSKGDGIGDVSSRCNSPAMLISPTHSVLMDQSNVHNNHTVSGSYDTKYAKSFRHFTREALPRLDNYRNMMSIQAAYRPTLDELHDMTLQGKAPPITSGTPAAAVDTGFVKFGWIKGVLVRCLLNIWGVMLFLRLSWVTGQSGIGQAWVVIFLATAVTAITGLSMSAISTNGQIKGAQSLLIILSTTVVTSITSLSMAAISTNGVVKGGGTYYMISRSLGPETGGSIGIIFAVANAVAVAMYTVGFAESLVDLLKSQDLKIVDDPTNSVRIIGSGAIVLLTCIVVIGMEWEAKAQVGLLVILVAAMIDFVIGSFIGPMDDEEYAKGFVGFNGSLFLENLMPAYSNASREGPQTFFSVFSIFFPAATGILAGANISGDLADPQDAIPKGTLLAILITTLSYLAFALIAGSCVLREATGNFTMSESLLLNGSLAERREYLDQTIRDCPPFTTMEEFELHGCQWGLLNSFQVMELVSAWGPLIYAGCFAATLSSALASLVSAPKVFQALCNDKLYPYLEFFGKGYGKNNEPVRGYVLTFIIALAFILIAELNAIAPLISNFFLAAYALVNFSTFHASLAKPVGWRPTFTYYNMWLSLAGGVLCVAVMFLISWGTALLTIAVLVFLYMVVVYRKPDVNWGSSTQAQTYKNALVSVQQLNNVDEHVKNYRPQILVLSGLPSVRPPLVDFAYLITKSLSLMVCGQIVKGNMNNRVRTALTQKGQNWFRTQKIKAFFCAVDDMDFEQGTNALLQAYGVGKLRPNILLMGYKHDWNTCTRDDLRQYFNVIHKALDMHVAVCLLRVDNGLDFSKKITFDDEQNLSPNHMADSSKSKSSSNDSLPRNQSFSQISHELGKYLSLGLWNLVNASSGDLSPTTDDKPGVKLDSTKRSSSPKKASAVIYKNIDGGDVSKDVMDDLMRFQRKYKHGTIDVWWLYDDGGLTLLLPYIINTRANWASCKLRVFALANKKDEFDAEQRSMAGLLAKFRIDYSDLKVIPDINKRPMETTRNFFEKQIADFRRDKDDYEDDDEVTISDTELMTLKDKTNRHMRLRELLLENSKNSTMVVMTLPMPRKGVVSAPLYMSWLELLTKDMPPFLLVRGNQTSVLTFYS